MKNTVKLCCLVSFLIIYGCITTKETAPKNDENQKVEVSHLVSENMLEKGFSKGTLIVSKSEACPYILNIEAYKDNLDPINLSDFFKGEIPEKVWVKFSNLRRPSRCNLARPVLISEISIRSN